MEKKNRFVTCAACYQLHFNNGNNNNFLTIIGNINNIEFY